MSKILKITGGVVTHHDPLVVTPRHLSSNICNYLIFSLFRGFRNWWLLLPMPSDKINGILRTVIDSLHELDLPLFSC